MTLWFPQSYRGRIISLFFLASAFSGIFGGPISGVLLSSLDGVMNMRGWHWLFLVGGVPCVLLGLCVLTYLKDHIDDAQWLSSSEKVHLKRLVEPKQPEKASHSLWAAIKTGIINFRCYLFSDSDCILWFKFLGASVNKKLRH